LTGAARFNAKPKSGVAFLEENNLIYQDLSSEMTKARSLATFLKGCTRIDKRLLGDFISKPDNLDILQAFIGLFDFKDVCFQLHRFDLPFILFLFCFRILLLRLCVNSWKRSDCRASPSKYLELQRRSHLPILQRDLVS
jgi:hypothetical protein